MKQLPEEYVTANVERFLAVRHVLPVRPCWSRTVLAKYLKSQGLMGTQKTTISTWERDFCFYIKDFRDQIPKGTPRDEEGKPIANYPLTPYQASTIYRLAYLITQFRPYLNGIKYTYLIQAIVKNRQIQRKYLSYAVFLYDQNNAA